MLDLQGLLPLGVPPYDWLGSFANTIDAEGNIFGYADGTYNGTSGFFAVEWSPVPEPASLSILTVGAVGLMVRRRRMGAAF